MTPYPIGHSHNPKSRLPMYVVRFLREWSETWWYQELGRKRGARIFDPLHQRAEAWQG